MKTLIAMTAATLLTTLAVPALAQSTDAPKAVVNYGDLNLSSASGQAVLHTRIARAVESVCPARPRPDELGSQRDYDSCRQQAWDSVRQQMAALPTQQKLAQFVLPGAR